ncbi:DNA polymerase III subunit gamma and tau [Branchiibius sp. NY16-3462-2]|uniref:DNA polymerase III subunit gamma and tau n=1 Tax=Branchiibius sp. NY16-3462-2 TaxID=1807500 RepID=UPI000791C3BF|nr:DNA polymerase III subunit gamma and tau [Branchiibius sp. NY16-3462-2]KYH43571.1 DNA polymerase III subunit gamma/tau [Branchiibius sp. NY16-3462-2]
MSIALYRRYRPENFADVIGQEHVTVPLMRALETGRVNHAYLFSGPRGCGKTTSARILARCLNCEQGPTPTPCGVCESCVALARGGPGTVDVIEIDAASHGGVDDARDLRERAAFGPAQSRYKVYIIDEAHMVTSAGFNALLKVVEEPPEHVKFVFATTEPEKVIGTIRSRTHHYPFRLVPPARLADYLASLCEAEGIAVEPGVLSFVTRAGGGSVRDSLSVLDQLIAGSGPEGLTYAGAASLLGFTDSELLDATIDAFAAGDGAAVFGQVDKVIESGHDPRRFVEDLLERLRDLILVAAAPESAAQVLREVPEDQLARMREQAAAYGAASLSRAADVVNTGLTEMTGATSPRLQLELICARVLLPAVSGEEGYAARLDRVERRLDMAGAGAPSAPASAPTASAAVAATPTATTNGDRVRLRDGMPHDSADAGSSRPKPAEGPAAEGSAAEEPVVAPEPVVAQGADPGAVTLEMVRRAWPDVVERVKGMRRVTWSMVTQHARVSEFDGRTVVLGISNQGLANGFDGGSHAALIQQAIRDELGADVRVTARFEATGNPPTPPASTAPDNSPPVNAPSANAGAPEPVSRPESGPPASHRDTRPTQQQEWSANTAAAPDWAQDTAGEADLVPTEGDAEPATSQPAGSPPPASEAADDIEARRATAANGADKARTAAREAMARQRDRGARGAEPVAEADPIESLDDENIDVQGELGIPVVQNLLGAKIIDEQVDGRP